MTGLLIAGAAAAAIAAIAGVVKWVVPGLTAIFNFFLDLANGLALFSGRKATVDPVTGEPLPEVPPLGIGLAQIRKDQAAIRAELSEQSTTLSDVTSVLQQVADQQVTLVQHAAKLAEHDGLIAGLLSANYQSSSEAALRAAELQRGPVVPGTTEEPT